MVPSQSTWLNKGPEEGFDRNKRVKSRNRHIVVDAQGLVLDVFVGAVNEADFKAAPVLLVSILDSHERILKILADQAYKGWLVDAVKSVYSCTLEISKKLGDGFVVSPWRWVVERTFAWLENARRLCRDYEELPAHHEGFVYIAMIRLMLHRLHGNRRQRRPDVNNVYTQLLQILQK